MEIWKRIAVGVVAASVAVGCTPTPEETCQKLEEISKNDPYGFKLSWSKCLTRMNEMKDRDADAYKCAAKRVKGLTNIDAALFVISICDKNGPSSKKKDKDKDDDDKDKGSESSNKTAKKGAHGDD